MENNHSFIGLAHIGIYTKDYEKTIDFYTKIMPFKIVKELVECPEGESGYFPLKYALLKLNDLYLEIMQPADRSMGNPVDGAVHHMGIRVKDIEQAVNYLIERGYDKNAVTPIGVNTTLYPGKTFRACTIIGPNSERIGLYEMDNEEFFV